MTLVVLAAACAGVVVRADVITFTGSVTADFAGSDSLLYTRAPGSVTDPDTVAPDGGPGPSGFDVIQVRFAYDIASDVGYFGALGVQLG